MISRPSFLRPSPTRFGSRSSTNFGLGQSAWENCANGLGSSNRRYRSNWPSCAFEAWCARGAQAERFAMKSAMLRFGRCSTPRASSLTTSLSARVPSSKTSPARTHATLTANNRRGLEGRFARELAALSWRDRALLRRRRDMGGLVAGRIPRVYCRRAGAGYPRELRRRAVCIHARLGLNSARGAISRTACDARRRHRSVVFALRTPRRRGAHRGLRRNDASRARSPQHLGVRAGVGADVAGLRVPRWRESSAQGRAPRHLRLSRRRAERCALHLGCVAAARKPRCRAADFPTSPAPPRRSPLGRERRLSSSR